MDAKITALDNLATPAVEDLVAIVDDVVGTPTTKKSTLQVIADLFKDLTQTLTNKTLTSPTIDAATLTGTQAYGDNAPNIAPKARAYRGSAQNDITGEEKILFDVESYDIGGDFDLANSKFIAPVAGYYSVNASVGFEHCVASTRHLVTVKRNGTEIMRSETHTGIGLEDLTGNVSDVVYLTASQYIEVYANTIDNSTTDIADESAQTFLSVHLLSV